MKVFITGGGGFIGSHAAEFYAQQGEEVVVFDNLSRMKFLGKSQDQNRYNWEYMGQYPNVKRVEGDIRNAELLLEDLRGSDVVIHAAAQTAVTSSYEDPRADFTVNALGTLNVLEASRSLPKPPTVIYCSTNKVYGSNVNRIPVVSDQTRYRFQEERFQRGIDETLGLDHCERSPYGCSKVSGDLYMQDYARHYGLKVGVFRLSCVYGPRQFGTADQGWLAWFAIATQIGKPIMIYGDGKQVRDVLFVTDLISAFHAFIQKATAHAVFNLGGGADHTISLLESLNLLQKRTGKRSPIQYGEWRPSDQKVYISDIRKAKNLLGWVPRISVEEGVSRLVEWVKNNEGLFRI